MRRIIKFLFLNTNNNQIIIKNTIWLFLGEFGIRILKLFIFIYAARKLGAEEWGIFSYTMALMSIIAVISDIGINSVLIKKIAGQKENNVYISTGIILKIILSLLSSIVFISLIFLIKNQNPIKILIPIMSIVLFIDSLREFGFTLNRIFEKMEIEAIIKLFTTIILVIFSFIFIRYNNTAISLSYSYLVSGIVGLLIAYFFSKKYIIKPIKNFDKKLLLPIFKEAWPLAIFSIFGIIITNIDTIILGLYKNSYSVGIYSVAQKPIQLLYLIPSLIGTVSLPIFSRMILVDKEKIDDLLKKLFKFIYLFIIPVTLIGILFGKQIMLFLFGLEYTKSGDLFKIMILAIPFMSAGIILSNILFIKGYQKKIAKSIIIATLVNFILCIILIPKIDFYGAAISITISQIINNFLIIWDARKLIKNGI